MLIPRDIRQTPYNLWRYVHPVSGVKFSGHYSLSSLMSMVLEYNSNNGFPPIENLDQKIIDYICKEDPNYCVSTEPPTLAERARSFAIAASEWVASGFKHVTHEQFEERKSICNKCPYWKGDSAFGYGGCGKCGCSALKLYLPSQKCPDGRWNSINV